jgi:hypothetical protein
VRLITKSRKSNAPSVTTWTSAACRKVFHEALETFLCTEAEVTVLCHVVSRHTFPQEVVRSRGFWNFQSIDLNVREWINFLGDVNVSKVGEV